MFYDYNKRNYLLPNGCKDLIDVLKLKQKEDRGQFLSSAAKAIIDLPPKPIKQQPLPSIPSEISVGECISVRELAALLNRKPFQLIADLMALKILVTANHVLDFETAQKIAKQYGCTVKKAS